MKKMGKKYLAVIISLLVVAGIWAAGRAPVDLETAVVKKGTVRATVTEKGRIVTEEYVNIYAEIPGNIKKVLVKEGQHVLQGALLAEIDSREIDAQIARLQGELTAAKGAEISSPAGSAGLLQQQELALEEAKAALKQTRVNYERIKNLYDSGAVTYVELEQAEADLESKQKSVGRTEAALDSVQQQIKGNKMQYLGQKQSMNAQLSHLRDQKEKARIEAEASGVVLMKNVEAGDFVNQGSPLFKMGDTQTFKVETYINTRDIANIKKGSFASVVFKVPGKDVEVQGIVINVAPAAEEMPSALGISEYRVKVTILMEKVPSGLVVIPGMEVDVRMTVQEAKNKLFIPKEAVFTDKGKDQVWVVRKGSAVPVEVETGIEGDESTEILAGLSKKEIIILDPHDEKLKEGIRIK